MTYINNIIHNDYVFIPLWIGAGGCIAWAWWSESTKIFSKISNTQLNVNTISPSNDSVSTITPHSFHWDTAETFRNSSYSFEQRIQASIQRDLERVHSNIDSIKSSENISKLNENISKLNELLSNTVLSSSKPVLTSPPQIVDLIDMSPLQSSGPVLTSYPPITEILSLSHLI